MQLNMSIFVYIDGFMVIKFQLFTGNTGKNLSKWHF